MSVLWTKYKKLSRPWKILLGVQGVLTVGILIQRVHVLNQAQLKKNAYNKFIRERREEIALKEAAVKETAQKDN